MKDKFVIIHMRIYNMLNTVSCQAERMYRVLRSYSDATYKECFPSNVTLQHATGWGKNTVTKYLKELSAAGLIKISRIKSGNQYTFITEFDNPTRGRKGNPKRSGHDSPKRSGRAFPKSGVFKKSPQTVVEQTEKPVLAGAKNYMSLTRLNNYSKQANEFASIFVKFQIEEKSCLLAKDFLNVCQKSRISVETLEAVCESFAATKLSHVKNKAGFLVTAIQEQRVISEGIEAIQRNNDFTLAEKRAMMRKTKEDEEADALNQIKVDRYNFLMKIKRYPDYDEKREICKRRALSNTFVKKLCDNSGEDANGVQYAIDEQMLKEYGYRSDQEKVNKAGVN